MRQLDGGGCFVDLLAAGAGAFEVGFECFAGVDFGAGWEGGFLAEGGGAAKRSCLGVGAGWGLDVLGCEACQWYAARRAHYRSFG